MRTKEEIAADYSKYRGKCKELSEAAVLADPTLTLVRGHYFCPLWCSQEPHWWCVRTDGTIHDPSVLQFPSNGSGIYEEFDGVVSCSNCGAEGTEHTMSFDGNYAFCSGECHARFVGL